MTVATVSLWILMRRSNLCDMAVKLRLACGQDLKGFCHFPHSMNVRHFVFGENIEATQKVLPHI